MFLPIVSMFMVELYGSYWAIMAVFDKKIHITLIGFITVDLILDRFAVLAYRFLRSALGVN